MYALNDNADIGFVGQKGVAIIGYGAIEGRRRASGASPLAGIPNPDRAKRPGRRLDASFG